MEIDGLFNMKRMFAKYNCVKLLLNLLQTDLTIFNLKCILKYFSLAACLQFAQL